MNFGKPCRRDDLISLSFLILSLIYEFDMFNIDVSQMTVLEYFNHLMNLKKDIKITDYC